MASLLEW